MRSALFVDFDNVYSGLRNLDPGSADRFARNPAEWMAWLNRELELPEHASPDAKRRILVRRCYLNPQAYPHFRAFFNIAGFEIVDCPALTNQGKTSTDIHMVLDIVDLLQHETRYDEFIVLSADADFTPVLRKLRRWDRRTTVLAIGFPSAAYRASADLVIDQDIFMRKALGFDEQAVTERRALAGAARPPSSLAFKAAVELVRRAVADSDKPVSLPRLAQLILKDIDGIDKKSWGGFHSFRAMLDSMSLRPLVVSWQHGTVHDPARHAGPPMKPGDPGAKAPEEPSAKAPSPREPAAAQVALVPVEAVPPSDGWDDAPELRSLAKRMHEATGVPRLPPAQYRTLFAHIEADLAAHPFKLMETSKRVRDTCRESGASISRADVNHVLRGLLFRDHDFENGSNDPATLARRLIENVLALCRREQVELDPETEAAIWTWIAGHCPPDAAAGAL